MELRADEVAGGYAGVWAEDWVGVGRAMGMYRRVVLAVLLKMLERFEAGGEEYGFLDMKVDLMTGRDFAEEDEMRGRGTVYAWIQGRGLEALAGHARWVANPGIAIPGLEGWGGVVERIKKVAGRVMERMEELRAANGGRLSFMMTTKGEGLRMEDGRVVKKEGMGESASFSDLFYGKGLAAAAVMLGDSRRLEEAKGILRRVAADVRSGKFVTDQEQLDVRNPVGAVAGRVPHGPRMILVGAAGLMVELTGEREWVEVGMEMVGHILRWHVKGGRPPKGGTPNGEAFDMWEFVDLEGRQYLEGGEGGKLRSDPGHGTEFVGLALKFLRVCEEKKIATDRHGQTRTEELRGVLGNVLRKNFGNGFTGKGICKAFDLVGRKAMNTDMPWWNLPETIRAGMEARACGEDVAEFEEMVRVCSNAFMKYFVRGDRWLMANQTVDEAGAVVERVPATPDADPGYHTGLSLIDALDLWERRDKGEKGFR